MRLTLALTPADAGRLARLPIVTARRDGRSRGQAVRIVWHDSLDRALATGGMALANERDEWRLDRVRPAPTEPWPPATDHRPIETASGLSAFTHALPEALAPVAAFEGRRTTIPLTMDGDSVILTVLQGVLRAVAAERDVARLTIEGDPAPVRHFAMLLADTMPLAVPCQALATEALHLADGTIPPPRRSGAPNLPHDGMALPDAFAHVLGHLADVMLCLAPMVADESSGPAPVHQMRVAVRRARSALSVFPPLADGEPVTEGLRTLSQTLGPARDWDVFMTETAPPVAKAMPDDPGLASLLRAGARRRRAARTALAAYLNGPAFARLCLELACVAEAPMDVVADTPPLMDHAAGVLRSRWKKLSNAAGALDELNSADLHGVRLKAKRLRYAAEFFAPMFPDKPTVRFLRRLSDLQERLGQFNDTAAASGLLRELSQRPGHAAGLVLGFTAARGARSRGKISTAWTRLRRREPFWGHPPKPRNDDAK